MSKIKCKICNSEVSDTRFGVCFNCATAETIIEEGLDMYDKPISKIDGYSMSMAKLKAILTLYRLNNNEQ